MSRRQNLSTSERRRHDRSAMIQWVALGLVAVLGLAAALLFADGGGGGGHVNAPPVAVTDAL